MSENINTKTVNTGQALADYIASLDYGSIIHYQDIEEITHRKWKTNLYYQDISKAKKILETKGKAITPIGGGDFQVLYPGDYSGEYARRVRLANQQIKRGGRILSGAPVNDMSLDERQTFNNVYDFHRRLEARFSGECVEVERITTLKKNPLAIAAEASG